MGEQLMQPTGHGSVLGLTSTFQQKATEDDTIIALVLAQSSAFTTLLSLIRLEPVSLSTSLEINTLYLAPALNVSPEIWKVSLPPSPSEVNFSIWPSVISSAVQLDPSCLKTLSVEEFNVGEEIGIVNLAEMTELVQAKLSLTAKLGWVEVFHSLGQGVGEGNISESKHCGLLLQSTTT
ncbi:MAG: hypothetical protein BWY53_00688 [Parcubacteria group bacterium ADurb.Bin326]|nr:MAG: hypothetical protein BWY53_00688 [Parcubacteria group bacterium ADurb.Bin326]